MNRASSYKLDLTGNFLTCSATIRTWAVARVAVARPLDHQGRPLKLSVVVSCRKPKVNQNEVIEVKSYTAKEKASGSCEVNDIGTRF